MPNMSANATVLRSGGHVSRTYLSIMTGAVVWTASVTATPTFPATTLAVSTVSGSHSNVKRGYRVVVETSGGVFKGTLNVRAAGTLSATSLPVRETSKATVNVASGDVVKVYDDVLLADKLVAADATFAPDQLSYSDQNSDPPPVVCSGGWWAGRLNSAGQADVAFTGSTSYTIDPDSSGSVTHLWTAPSGTFTVGTSTSADPTVRWTAAGSYNVIHSVTDSSNSKSREQYVRVRVHSDADPAYDCVLEQVQATEDRGWSATVRMFDSLPLSTLPDGAPVCVWSDDSAGASAVEFGSTSAGRHHIILCGYVRRDSQTLSPDINDLRIEIISPLARLMEVPGFSKVMERNQSPNDWSKIKTLTVRRAIVQLIAFYTWAIESGIDLTFTGFSDANYPLLYLQAQTPAAQIAELADSRDARIVCLKHGQIDVQERPELTALSSRSGMTTTFPLTSDDIDAGNGSDGIQVSREHYRPVMMLEGRGTAAATSVTASTPMFSRWPGTPGYGTENTTVERLIADTQTSLNERTGRRGAVLDRVYQTSTGTMLHAPEVRLAVRGAYWRIMDFYREWLTLSYAANTNLRGIDLSAFRWRIVSINVAWEDLTAQTTLTLQAETHAEAGVTYYPPPDDSTLIDTPPFDFLPGPDITLPLPIPNMPPGTNIPPEKFWAVGLSLSGGYTVITRTTAFDPVAQTISWQTCDGDQVTGLGTGGCSDPFNYRRKFVITETGLWKTDDLWVAGTPTWTQVATNNTIWGDPGRVSQQIVMSVNRRGFIGLLSAGTVGYSFDYGATWATAAPAIGGGYASAWDTGRAQIQMAERNPGVMLWGGSGGLAISSNYGASWSTITTAPHTRFHVPYTRSDGTPNRAGTGTTNTEVFSTVYEGDQYYSSLYRTLVSNATLVSRTAMNAPAWPTVVKPIAQYNPIMTATGDGSKLTIVTISNALEWNTCLVRGTVVNGNVSTWTAGPNFTFGGAFASVFGYSTWNSTVAILWVTYSGGFAANQGFAYYFDTDDLTRYFSITPPVSNNQVAYLEADLSAVQ